MWVECKRYLWCYLKKEIEEG